MADLTKLIAVEKAARELRDDLLMRAKMNAWQNDGEIVVECGAGVWSRLNKAIATTNGETSHG